MDSSSVYLVQTDTTVGFCSKNASALASIKGRDPKKPLIITTAGTNELNKLTRVPKKWRKSVRRAKKTTFVYPQNIAIRVVHDGEYFGFLKKFGWLYSTSANRSGGKFDFDFASEAADEIVTTKDGFSEKAPSQIIKIGKKPKRLR